MLRSEIIRTCSHDAVAQAALRSLDANFYSRITKLASAHDCNAGAYAAALVRRFEQEADEDAWYALGAATTRRDMPVLEGFRFILESMLDYSVSEIGRNSPRGAEARAAPALKSKSARVLLAAA